MKFHPASLVVPHDGSTAAQLPFHFFEKRFGGLLIGGGANHVGYGLQRPPFSCRHSDVHVAILINEYVSRLTCLKSHHRYLELMSRVIDSVSVADLSPRITAPSQLSRLHY